MIDAIPMPHNMQLEYALLGAMVCNNDLIRRLHFLDESHFYSQPHAAIFAAMLRLLESGEPITPFTITVEHEAEETLKDAGGITRYLAGAVSAASLVWNAVADAKMLVEMAQKRRFIASCRTAAEHAAESDSSAAEHAASLNSQIETMLTAGPKLFLSDHDVIEEILADLASQKQPVSTGLRQLDDCMGGGMFPGKSYGFAARKKVGKTILAGTISCNLAQQGVKHLFVCGEMSPKEIHQRTLARLTDSFPSAFRTEHGQHPAFLAKIAKAKAEANRCTLYHNAPGLTFDDLRRVLSTAVYQHRISGFILDYWQLVGGKKNGQSTAEHLDQVAQWVADFCRKHDLWSITMAQLNQGGNTRGGEGVRLAFDQVYAIRGMLPPGEKLDDDAVNEDLTYPYRWLEMLDTRYTKWGNVGSETQPGFRVEDNGPYFSEDWRDA